MAASFVMCDLDRGVGALKSAQETFSSGEVIVEASGTCRSIKTCVTERGTHSALASRVKQKSWNGASAGSLTERMHETLLVFGVRLYDVQVLSGHLDAIDIWHLLQRIRAKGERLCVLKLRQPRAGPFG